MQSNWLSFSYFGPTVVWFCSTIGLSYDICVTVVLYIQIVAATTLSLRLHEPISASPLTNQFFVNTKFRCSFYIDLSVLKRKHSIPTPQNCSEHLTWLLKRYSVTWTLSLPDVSLLQTPNTQVKFRSCRQGTDELHVSLWTRRIWQAAPLQKVSAKEHRHLPLWQIRYRFSRQYSHVWL